MAWCIDKLCLSSFLGQEAGGPEPDMLDQNVLHNFGFHQQAVGVLTGA
jgi:hypothetical protein